MVDNTEILAYSIKQVAQMLQLPLSTVTYYCRTNKLPCIKVGRHYRILKSDLTRFLKECKDNTVVL